MEELKNKIRYLKDVQGLSFRQIAIQTGLSRHKVSKLYSGNCQPHRAKEPLLNPYADLIVRWFKDCPSLKAKQVYERLKQRGVPIGARTVDRYTQRFRKKKDKIYWPLTFLPGEEGQVDWFFVTHPHLGKLCGFALILSYSRYLFVHLFERASFEFFIQGHLMAFSAFGGYPHALRYDNLRSVVLKKEPLQYNSSFLEFAHHYSFEIRLCNLAAGNEKGRVERVIRSMRETFLNTAEHHQSLGAMNHALHEWVAQKNDTIHRATQKKPVDAKKEEVLKTLPDRPWNNVLIHPPKKTSKTGMVTFDTNSYSVPDYLTGKLISIHAQVDSIELYGPDGKKVASHPRCFKRYQQMINPIHRSVARLSKPAKRQRIHALMKNMSKETRIFLEQNQQLGEDSFHSAYQLFKLLKTHSRATLLSVVRETIRGKAHKMAYIHSLLNSSPQTCPEEVSPQNKALLSLDYQARDLEDYHDSV